MDHQFDSSDNISDKKVYCLTSACSFSCGNLVPKVLKQSGKVTIIGQTSGGGTCIVGQMVASGGTFIQFSSPNQMCVVKNGSFYNIDRGIAPDYDISNPETFYDRQELVDNYIHKIV
jgi:C-terminal processing protease CtpA/Prc